jgi:mannitol-1-/sugar-/sorbitol-6-phosphatase
MTSDVWIRCGALLFDLDGVLVDSAACVEATWHRWALRHALDPAAVITVAHGRRTIETVRLVAPHLAADAEAAALAAIESTTTEGVHEIAGARELLQTLPRGTWAIVTSGVRAVATLRIRHTGLPTPDVLICADEISNGKPDPEGYLTAARRLGVAPEACIVIEDTPAGVDAARAAGMRSIAVAGTYPPQMLQAATYTIPSLAGLSVVAARACGPIELRLTLA